MNATIRNLATDAVQALCDFQAALPEGFSMNLTAAEQSREKALRERPAFAALARNPIVAAVRAARDATAIRFAWTASPEGVRISAHAHRIGAKGNPVGTARVRELVTVSPAQAVAVLNALASA